MQETDDTNSRETLKLKFMILRDELNEAVSQVMKAISGKTTVPILTGIKITAAPDGITLTGSNSDISIKSFIPAEEDGSENASIDLPGSIVLPSRLFSELVRKLPEEEVYINADNRLTAIIQSGSSEFNLNGLDPEEYPNLPVINEKESFRIKKDLLKDVIRQTVFSVSVSETRPVLTGVKWMIQQDNLVCVATDSHRLSQRGIKIERADHSEDQQLVIPGQSLNELAKILDDGTDDSVEIVMTENQILFKTDHVQFYSRLLEGNYPDTSRLIPTERKTTITLEKKALYQAIERASLLAKEEKNNVVKLVADENKIEISSQSLELGRVFETIQAEKFEGEEVRISFSAKFMMDALSRLDAQNVRIHFIGPMRPIIIRPVDAEEILMLILPIRTF